MKIIIKEQQPAADDPIDFAHNMIAADGFDKAHEVATARAAFWQQVVEIIKDVWP